MLGVGEVQQRYSLDDARAARRVIQEAGGRRIGNRLLVRLDMLDAWERAGSQVALSPISDQPLRSRSRRTAPAVLAPGWFLQGGGA